MNFFDGLNLWVSVCLMAMNRRSLGQGLVLRRYIKRSKARVIDPLNRYRGATLEVQGRVVQLRGFRTSDYEVFYQIFGFDQLFILDLSHYQVICLNDKMFLSI